MFSSMFRQMADEMAKVEDVWQDTLNNYNQEHNHSCPHQDSEGSESGSSNVCPVSGQQVTAVNRGPGSDWLSLIPQSYLASRTGGSINFPSVDVSETNESVLVRAEVPGMKREDIKVTLEGRNLVLDGETSSQHEEQDENFTHRERHWGKFHRSFRLPAEVDREGIKASYTDGVLQVSLPKTPKEVAHEIAIE